MATILQPGRRNGTIESPFTPTDRQNSLTVSVLIDPLDIAGIGEVTFDLKVEQSADGVLWWPLGGMSVRDVAEALAGFDKLGNPNTLYLRLTEQIYRADVFRDQRYADFGGFTYELKNEEDGAHYYQMALCPQIRVRSVTNRSLRYGLDLGTLQKAAPPCPLGRRSASLLGTFAAAESATSPVTSGSRTTTSGSLIVGQGAAWRSVSGFALTISDDKSNTYTELFEISASAGAGSFGWGVLAYNLAGTRGASHEEILTSGADSCCVGGLEFDGVDSFDTSGTEADGSSTAPSCTVTPSTDTALVVGLMIYDGSGTTFAANVGTLGLEVDENNDRQANGTLYRVAQASGGAITTSWTLAASRVWAARSAAFTETASATWEQEGFRFYDDDGDEDESTALANQDTSIEREADNNTRLRLLLNTDAADPGSETMRLEYKEDSESSDRWRAVGTGTWGALPTITSATSTPDATAGTTIAASYPATVAAGDLLIFVVAKDDDATGITDTTGGLTEIRNGNTGSGTDGVCLYVGYKIADGTEDGTTHTFTGDSEEWQAYCIRILAGEFDPTNPIDSASALNGGTTGEAITAEFTCTRAGGLVIACGAVDIDPMDATFSPAGWTDVADNDAGEVTAWVSTRDAATTAAETIAATTFGINASDANTCCAFVVNAPVGNPQINLAASTHITASGENTTARLTAPSGKTTADFGGGRIQDDEVTADAVDLAVDEYGEWEWCLTADSGEVVAGEVYQFRATRAGVVLDTYSVTPEWEIGAGGQNINVGLVTESDQTQTLSRTKSVSLARITESNTSQVLSPSRLYQVAQVSEADTPSEFTHTLANVVSQITETDTSGTITSTKSVSAGMVTETDSLLAFGAVRSYLVGLNTETDTAQAMSESKSASIGLVSETDTPQPITATGPGVTGTFVRKLVNRTGILFDAVCPVNWQCQLNNNLFVWWKGMPGWAGGPRLIDITKPGDNLRHGAFTNISIPASSSSGWTDGSNLSPAVRLDGTDDVITTTMSPAVNPNFSMTIEAVVRFRSFTESIFGAVPGAVILSSRQADGDRSPTFLTHNYPSGGGSAQHLAFGADSSSVALGAVGATEIVADVWYHCVGVFEYTNAATFAGNWNVYLNGKQDSTTNNFNLTGSVVLPFTGTITLGDEPMWGATSNIDIESVAIYSKHLDPDTIAKLYQEYKQGYPNRLRRTPQRRVMATVSGDQNINVAQVTETDTPQATTATKSLAFGMVVETDASLTFSVTRTQNVGQITETDTPQAFTHSLSQSVAQTVETDTAQAIESRRLYPAAQATETDTSNSMEAMRQHSVGQITETDTASPFGHSLAQSVGQTTETDTSQAIDGRRLYAAAQVTETDTANAFSRISSYQIGLVAETDTALGLGQNTEIGVGLVTGTDTSNGATVTKSVAVSIVTETHTPQAIDRLVAYQLAMVSETDSSQATAAVRSYSIGLTTETDTPVSVTTTKSSTIGQVEEDNSATPLGSGVLVDVDQVSETDTTQALSRTKTKEFGQVTETDSAVAFQVDSSYGFGQVTESDTSGALSATKSATVGQVVETLVLGAFSCTKTKSIGIVTEADLAQQFASLKLTAFGQVSETDLAHALSGATKSRTIGTVTETSVVFGFEIIGGSIIVGPYYIDAASVYLSGASVTDTISAGLDSGQTLSLGAATAQLLRRGNS